MSFIQLVRTKRYSDFDFNDEKKRFLYRWSWLDLREILDCYKRRRKNEIERAR